MPLPDRAALLEAAARLGVPLDSTQADRLLEYLVLLAKWNRAVNLTAVRDPSTMFTHHLLDCLAVVAPLRRFSKSTSLLDVGSGAGLPGIVIAVAMPEMQVTCVDAVAKKAAFIRQAAAELGLRSLSAKHARVEALAEEFDVIASRAFATLAEFTSLTRRQLGNHGAWMAMKGLVPESEIAALPPDVEVFHVEPLSIPGLEASRCLVWMKQAQASKSSACNYVTLHGPRLR